LQQKIQECRMKLSGITEKLIHNNPFLRGKTSEVNALNE